MQTPLPPASERKESDYVYCVENLELENGAMYNGEAIKEVTPKNSRGLQIGVSWLIPKGRGEIFYANGDSYVGQVLNGKPDGLGTKK